MPQAFVTGATGFLGQHLVHQLIDAGWSVAVLHRAGSDLSSLAGLHIEHHVGDVTDRESVLRAVAHPFDAVFHVAADTSMRVQDADRQQAINVDGTRHVIEAVRESGSRRLIHTSSIAVWGIPQEKPVNEQTPHDTGAYWIGYCRTKAESEALVRDSAADTGAVILSPAHVMGPQDRHNWVRLFQMVAAEKLPGIPPGTGSFADVRDVARTHINAVERGTTGGVYLLGGENHTFAAVVRMIAQATGARVRKPVVPGAALRALAHIKGWLARIRGGEPDLTPEEAAMVIADVPVDSSLAVRELDHAIRPLAETIEDTVAWMKAEGMLPP